LSRILIVDDDPHIREALQDSLEAEGYDVVAAHDGQTALALISLEARPSHITGVILDMEMPVVHGIEVAKAVSGSSDLNDFGLSRQTDVRRGPAQRCQCVFGQAVCKTPVGPIMC